MPRPDAFDKDPVRVGQRVEAPVVRGDADAGVVEPAASDAQAPQNIMDTPEIVVILLSDLDIETSLGLVRHPALGIEVSSREDRGLARRRQIGRAQPARRFNDPDASKPLPGRSPYL